MEFTSGLSAILLPSRQIEYVTDPRLSVDAVHFNCTLRGACEVFQLATREPKEGKIARDRSSLRPVRSFAAIPAFSVCFRRPVPIGADPYKKSAPVAIREKP